MGKVRKYCPRCGKIVDMGHNHREEWLKKRKVKKWEGARYKDPHGARKIRNGARWQKLRLEIKRRDGGVDQIALHGLDGEPYIQSQHLQVHHIIPMSEDASRAYDPYNLITVSPRTHEMAETGQIGRDVLLAIAKANQLRYERGE